MIKSSVDDTIDDDVIRRDVDILETVVYWKCIEAGAEAVAVYQAHNLLKVIDSVTDI